MADKKYRVSEITKNKLINAAGELFSTQGTEKVSVRDITRLAGTKENAISYHFGGKEGLIEAVWEKATERFSSFDYLEYIENNTKLLDTKEGQIKTISYIIKSFYNCFYENDKEALWFNRFFLKGAFSENGIKHLRKALSAYWAKTLIMVYKKITKSNDDNKAQNWIICIASPCVFVAPNMDILDKGFLPKKVTKNVYKQLCKEVTKYALYSIGLI